LVNSFQLQFSVAVAVTVAVFSRSFQSQSQFLVSVVVAVFSGKKSLLSFSEKDPFQFRIGL